jgi:hypothetical protein
VFINRAQCLRTGEILSEKSYGHWPARPWRYAVHLDQLRLDPFVAEEALLERNFHREPKHAHSGIGKRDFARFGTVPPIGLPEDEDDQLR